MTQSLTEIKHDAKESYLKHCSALGFVKILGILIFLCIFLLTSSEEGWAQTLTLENEYLYVEFQESLPAVDHYVLKSNNHVIYGHISYYSYWAQIFHEGSLQYIYPNVDSITKGSDRVCYHVRGELDSLQVVTFDLCYILSGNSVELSFGNVQETPGYKLVVVRPPDLLNVRADQGGAKLVFPYAEGRLIDVAATTIGEYSDGGTGGWNHAMLLGMLYHQGALAICSYDNLDMSLEERVFDHLGDRLGAINIYFYYRHPPTNFEMASFVDVFDEQTTSLIAKLIFLADYDQDGDIDWMDGAKFLRDQLRVVPEPKYVLSWMTKLGGSFVSNITQHLQTIEKLYHLTDQNKIYSYLLDYYPTPTMFSIFGYEGDINPEWASLDEVKYVFETAEKNFNTFLSFHDNYLNYYPGTPGYDPALRVVNPDGTLLETPPLPGHSVAYVADAYEHAVQLGIERVKRTLSRYPIKESHHIDAFTFLPVIDYSLESPSSREKNRRGIKLIIDEFNKYGVDVTGDGLIGFFVGPGMGGWFLRTPRVLEDNLPWSGAEVIPFLEFIYHGKQLYGLHDPRDYEGGLLLEEVDIVVFLEPLLLGASSGAHIVWAAQDDLDIDKFYLIDLPWMALNQRFMQDYIANGSYRKITYDGDTFVEIDYDSKTYTVQVDGRVIAHNYTTFYPKNESTFLIYSRDAKTISESLPNEWTKDMILLKLTENGINPSVPFQFSDGRITFQAEANAPYKLVKLNPSPTSITLQSPSEGAVFNCCSLITTHQPTFSWTTTETFASSSILFSTSPTDFATRGVLITKASVRGAGSSWIPSSFVWKRLMTSSSQNGEVYWKVIGTRSNRTTAESEVWSFSIGPPQPVTINSPPEGPLPGASPPTFDFDTNCNVKFKLEISSESDFKDSKKIKSFNYTTRDPNKDQKLVKTLPTVQWNSVKKLIGTAEGHFRIKAWDGINRESASETRSFTIY